MQSSPSPAVAAPVGHYRWWVIAAMLAAITAINYIDRQTLAVLVGEVKKDIAISEVEYGRMTSLFLLGYALMYAGGGWLVDRIGVRFGYLLIAGAWSLACAAHALAASAGGLIAARFSLGLAEGGGFPASAKAVAEWFPARERSLAIGIFNTGSAAGLIGMAEAAGSALFAELVGRILEATSRDYTIPFLLTGILHPLAFFVIDLGIRKIQPLARFATPGPTSQPGSVS